LCDVAVERQVEITGSDAAQFTQLLTPRDLRNCAVGLAEATVVAKLFYDPKKKLPLHIG